MIGAAEAMSRSSVALSDSETSTISAVEAVSTSSATWSNYGEHLISYGNVFIGGVVSGLLLYNTYGEVIRGYLQPAPPDNHQDDVIHQQQHQEVMGADDQITTNNYPLVQLMGVAMRNIRSANGTAVGLRSSGGQMMFIIDIGRVTELRQIHPVFVIDHNLMSFVVNNAPYRVVVAAGHHNATTITAYDQRLLLATVRRAIRLAMGNIQYCQTREFRGHFIIQYHIMESNIAPATTPPRVEIQELNNDGDADAPPSEDDA